MITTIILDVLNIFLTVLLSPILTQPDAILSSNLTSAIQNIQGFISTVDPIFPVVTLLATFGVVLTIEVALFFYKAIMWLIKKIPMIS